MKRLIMLAVAMGAAAALAVIPAQATFRGANGLLVYQAQTGAHVQLFSVRPDGTGVRQLTRFADSDAVQALWSPQGTKVVFMRAWGPNKTRIYTMNADGSGLHELDRHLRLTYAWFPDGKHLLLLQNLRWTIVTAAGMEPRAAGIPGGGGSPCVLADGKRVVLMVSRSDGDAAIFAGPIGGGPGSLQRISPWQTMTDKIDCSPDGSTVVFSAPATESAQSTNVYRVGIDGKGLRQLTHSADGTDNGADSWSPDGHKIAFASNRSGTFQIYSMNADGTGVRQITHGAEGHLASWGSHP
jgi:Tol biopolymer transport system component